MSCFLLNKSTAKPLALLKTCYRKDDIHAISNPHWTAFSHSNTGFVSRALETEAEAINHSGLHSSHSDVLQTVQTDSNGNIRNDGQHFYDYDARNRLTRTDNRVSYQYNASNQRVRKSSPTSTTLYAWSNDRIIGEYTSNGSPITETIYLNDTPVGLLKDGNRYRIFADPIDTPRLITTETNQPQWRWDSKPFGVPSL